MQDTDKKGISGRLRARLQSGTILGAWTPRQRIPLSVINFMRALCEQTDIGFNQAARGSAFSPYKAAKDRFNKIWAGRASYETDPDEIRTPTSCFKTLRGALTAYWTSEKWAEAWASTGALAAITTMNAQNIVWIAEASAQFIDSIATFVQPGSAISLDTPMKNFVMLGGLLGLQSFLGWASMKGNMDMQRNMSGWMTDRYNQSVFARHDIVQRITHNQTEDSKEPDAMPDNPDQRMAYATRQVTGNLISLGGGALSMVMTAGFIAVALHEKSVPVTVLDDLARTINAQFPDGVIDLVPGKNGTAILAGMIAAIYLTATLRKALTLGLKIKENDADMQKARGVHYQTLSDTFRSGDAIAASKSHKTLKATMRSAYSEVDMHWKSGNHLFRRYSTFIDFQHAFGNYILAAIPGLAGVASKNLSLGGFVASQGLCSAFINQVHFVFNAIPEHAYMMSAATRLQELAIMIDKAHDKEKFYRLTGLHDFKHTVIAEENTTDILRTQNLHLMHRGEMITPYLSVDDFSLKSREWIYIKGIKGSGKSSLVKALAGTWAYGRGYVETRENARVFYACQDADITGNRTLAEHILYGAPDEDEIPANLHSDADLLLSNPEDHRDRIIRAITQAGLGQFVDRLNEKTNAGKAWQKILSGGEKQQLVLARILFQKPDIILLDESASALDPANRTEFFTALKTHCPEASVMAIVHDDKMPLDAKGQSFFDRMLTVSNGTATIVPLSCTRFPSFGTCSPPAMNFH